MLVQMRSEFAVVFCDSNCASIEQTVYRLHTLLEVAVGPVASYSHVLLHAMIALHTGGVEAL
jgi:hypothetical protein